MSGSAEVGAGSQYRLVDGYDLVIIDLDGVVYLIDQPIPSAVAAVAELHRTGPPVVYATNNASRRAGQVAALLTGMGVPADGREVLTSAQAAAALLAQRLPAGAPVLVVGADALRAEIRDVGLSPVDTAEDRPVAVVQGYGSQVGWAQLAEACVAVQAGAIWVVTNTDRTLPTPRGPLPGNGSLVAALRTALDREPDVVVGKPEPALFQEAARRVGARRALVVGDRLDTDIAGARRSGMDSLLVLTGVSDAANVLDAPADQRPTHVAADLTGLFDGADVVRVPDVVDLPNGAAPGGWRVSHDDAVLTLTGSGDPMAALRLLCAAAWAGGVYGAARAGGQATGVAAGSPQAASALRQLSLPA